MLSVIGVSILIGLVVFGVILVPSLFAGALLQSSPIIALVIVAIPTLLVVSVLWVAVPATVVERISAFAAPARSVDLTRGRRTSVFLVLCVLGLLSFGTTWIVGQLAQTGSFSIMTILVGSQVVGAIETGFSGATTAVGYHDLRVSHESIGTDDLTKVFD